MLSGTEFYDDGHLPGHFHEFLFSPARSEKTESLKNFYLSEK